LRFKVDENLPVEAATLLRDAGHEATTVLEEGLGAAPDPGLYARCVAEERVLVTLDLDFADIRLYPPAGSPGILVLRLGRQDKPVVLACLARILEVLKREAIEHRLWVTDGLNVRIHDGDDLAPDA
jgi:predicted nuclease of predicted toxin-antitoxin system